MEQQQFSNLDFPPPEPHIVQLDERGRLVLPMAIRNKLALKPNQKLIASIHSGTLRLVTVKAQISKVQGIISQLSPERCLSEELMQERRQEAELE